MHIDTRFIKATDADEFFITATSQPGVRIQEQATKIFTAIKNILEATDSIILEERIFSSENIIDIVRLVRENIYTNLNDGVIPNYLVIPKGNYSETVSMQVHTVRSTKKPEILYLGQKALGRSLVYGDRKYITLTGITGDEFEEEQQQAGAMFKKADLLLKQAGGDMHSVACTWIWIKDILKWYDNFNKVRTQFYIEKALIKGENDLHLPASVGIGVSPAGNAKCSLDLFAVIGEKDSIKYLIESSEQGSPYEYGSAFSRASITNTPGGKTVFISGTAAVGPKGETEYIGNAEAQINSTIKHVRAVLKDTGCSDENVVRMVAYCKTIEVEKLFAKLHNDLPWPRLTVISDICRDNLFFEIEVTACPGTQKYYIT